MCMSLTCAGIATELRQRLSTSWAAQQPHAANHLPPRLAICSHHNPPAAHLHCGVATHQVGQGARGGLQAGGEKLQAQWAMLGRQAAPVGSPALGNNTPSHALRRLPAHIVLAPATMRQAALALACLAPSLPLWARMDTSSGTAW